MDYYEVEYTIENLADDLKKKQSSEREQQDEYNPNSMMRNTQNNYKNSINIPKMPSMPSMGKMPKM